MESSDAPAATAEPLVELTTHRPWPGSRHASPCPTRPFSAAAEKEEFVGV